MMTLVFAMLGIITIFIILVVFYMMISSKSKDIGILKSMGISTGSVVCALANGCIDNKSPL